ncbi:MAG: tetratricopeptide repeat-containing protein [Bryobacteraceae bacterium]|jgi:hypothetical protein
MRAFIIRPFGKRTAGGFELDFDKVESDLIEPALEGLGAQGRTTGEILEAGNIRMDMFQELLVADVVIADITMNNPNAFYELGIRHALQEKRTFLIRAKLPAPKVESVEEYKQKTKEHEVPFDLKTDRYMEYAPEKPEDSVAKLTQGLRESFATERQDSPVFLSLPDLKPQKREGFIPVPLGFGEAVQRAEKEKDARGLTLLGLEAEGFRWESSGFRVVGRALLLIKEYGAAKNAWESLYKLDNFDYEANISLGNIYQRLKDLTGSDQALNRALRSATERKQLAEIHGQLGRNKKDLWTREWGKAEPAEQARVALQSPLLRDAYDQYLVAYRQDLNSYYPGINALGLAIMIVELAARYPDDWIGQFVDEDAAALELKEIRRSKEQTANALQLRFAYVDKPEASSEEDKNDPWLMGSAGDLSLLTGTNAKRAIFFYKKAATEAPFILDAARKQLLLFAALGVSGANVKEALASFGPGAADVPKERIERLILFTGHRVDGAKREKPRFPAAMEGAARDAIRVAVAAERSVTAGAIFGVAGGANGGDILFLEVCDELGIPTEMMLALPEGPFMEKSVAADDPMWEKRFYTQLGKHPNTPVLAKSEELPQWLQGKKGYDVWQRNNLWLLSEALCRSPENLTLIALWDGGTGDGPGGTENMVNLARDRGAKVIHLNTKTLFGLP